MTITESKKLLLVEDEMLIALGQILMLEKSGYSVVHAQSGENAVEIILGNHSIDLILMDIDLGKGISGPEAAEQILNIKTLPIVFLTSHSESDMVDKVKAITRYGYIVKDSGEFVILSSIEMAFELFEAHTNIEQKLQILDEKEKFFSKIFHTNPVLMSVSTVADGLFIEVNETFLNILGYERDEIIGKKSTNLNLWADINDRSKAISLLVRDGYLRHYETQILTKTGSIRHGLFSIDYIEMQGEKCMLSAMTDITENKIIQEKIRRSEENFKNIFDQAIVGIANLSLNGVFFEVNSRFCEITGYNRNELLTMNYADITHPDDLSIDEDYISKVLKDEIDSYTIEKRYIHKEGHIVWVLLYSNVIRDQNRKIKFAIAVVDDISSRKLTEDALWKSETLYHLLADHMSDAVWLMDLNLKTTYCSPSVLKLRGYTVEEILKVPIEQQLTDDSFKIAMAVFKDEMEKVNADSSYSFVKSLELEFLRKDGSIFLGDTTFTLIRGNDGMPETILGESKNITERKNAEEKINKLLIEKELLLKEVHHRIKNNMHTIASLLYLQADSINDTAASAHLTDAYNRVQSMMIIYDKLYKSSDFREISADAYLTELIASISSTISTASNIQVISNVENCSIGTDLLFPVGIIINELLTNTFKYAFPDKRDGRITISLKKNSSTIIINFNDNGIGIPESVISMESKGFGINLVKILVEQLQGKLELNGSNGADYTISFPL